MSESVSDMLRDEFGDSVPPKSMAAVEMVEQWTERERSDAWFFLAGLNPETIAPVHEHVMRARAHLEEYLARKNAKHQESADPPCCDPGPYCDDVPNCVITSEHEPDCGRPLPCPDHPAPDVARRRRVDHRNGYHKSITDPSCSLCAGGKSAPEVGAKTEWPSDRIVPDGFTEGLGFRA